MREIMQTNIRIAPRFWETGITIAAGYSGTSSSEILRDVADNYPEISAEWIPNKMVALQRAGDEATVVDARAVASTKHVGTNLFPIAACVEHHVDEEPEKKYSPK
jgi:indolepyruvate ferredoxin oxidoreductase alpha subunit